MLTKYLAAAAGNSGGETLLFNAVTWSGTGGAQSITGVGFQPDFVWVKAYNQTSSHNAYDSVRGINKGLFPNLTAVESDRTVAGGSLTSFDSDGFSVGTDSGTSTGLSNSGYNYVGWCFKAGGAAVTNTDGAITSSVSANVGGGFSVATYTGNGSTGTIGHGLSSTPELVIIKNRGAVASWYVGSPLLNTGYYLVLNSDAAKAYYNDGSGGAFFNYGGWSDSVVNVYNANSTSINSSSYSYVMYSFHSVEGFIKIGTYSGTGADQAITGVGFQPAVVIAKRIDSTSNWAIADDVRTTAGEGHQLYPNLTNPQSISAPWTMESDGFSLDGGGVDYNASGGTYLYMAIKGVD